jgi:hypothetical protein
MTKQVAAQKSTGMVHVYSTLANSQEFTTYLPGGADLPIVDRQVLVKGGAGIATKNLLTPLGVHTAISEDDYNAIKDLKHFKDFVDRGHIRVEKRQAAELERIVSDMNPRDPGGPITPADYAATPNDGSVPIPVAQEKLGNGWVLR